MMTKLTLHSPDFTQANIAKLAELFPNCVTEIKDGQSKDELGRMKGGVKIHPSSLKYAIDFDQLRQELSPFVVEGPQERYQLNWPGKREALLTANAPIAKTLRPCREESVNFDSTQNLFIEGDNLDALKLLQEIYLGKVKMIYIDPPYNTGKEFIYDDDFSEDTASYFQRSNQKDEAGQRMVANTETNGRFHSDWLSMMYPRLKLARNLLRDDGVIFISIDDHEAHNLRKICNEIFGEDNFKANIVWRRTVSGAVSGQGFSVSHDHVLCYSKNSNTELGRLPVDDEKEYKNPDNDPRGGYKAQKLERTLEGARPSMTFEILTPSGSITRTWAVSPQKFQELLLDNRIIFSKSGTPYYKQFLAEYRGKLPNTWWGKEAGNNQEGSKELSSLLGNKNLFTNPKPLKLLLQLLLIGASDQESIVLDFFSGSATTAHAVMSLNAEDGSQRKFIMVQIPEPCDDKSEAYKAGYKTIAEIGKERIRRAGLKIKDELESKAEGTMMKDEEKTRLKDEGGRMKGEEESSSFIPQPSSLDIGFRVLKIDSSNMKDVYYTPDAVQQTHLFDQIDNIREDRTPEDLLFQVLLDWGVDLTLPITQESIAGKTVLFVDDNALAACFDADINEAFVKELAARHPLRVVFRDAGFISDSVKINIEQIFKLISPTTEIKTL